MRKASHDSARCTSRRVPVLARVWTPPAAEIRALTALVRRLDSLREMQTSEKNRLSAGPASVQVADSIQAVLTFLEQQIAAIQQQIQEHINYHPDLKGKRDLLTSIPGIAETTAAAILAELGELNQFTAARQVAAFAGLVPKIRQSGSSVRGRSTLSKRGSSRLRHSLYFPALTALRFNPPVRALGERLRDKGKAKMQIVAAAMRKLLHLCYGVLKSGKPFDPDFAAKAA